MKATLEFTLPEENIEHACAVKGLDTLFVIDELLNEIRKSLKYNCGAFHRSDEDDERVNEVRIDTLEKVRSYILELRDNYDIPHIN
jgi:hypothetical protein